MWTAIEAVAAGARESTKATADPVPEKISVVKETEEMALPIMPMGKSLSVNRKGVATL